MNPEVLPTVRIRYLLAEIIGELDRIDGTGSPLEDVERMLASPQAPKCLCGDHRPKGYLSRPIIYPKEDEGLGCTSEAILRKELERMSEMLLFAHLGAGPARLAQRSQHQVEFLVHLCSRAQLKDGRGCWASELHGAFTMDGPSLDWVAKAVAGDMRARQAAALWISARRVDKERSIV